MTFGFASTKSHFAATRDSSVVARGTFRSILAPVRIWAVASAIAFPASSLAQNLDGAASEQLVAPASTLELDVQNAPVSTPTNQVAKSTEAHTTTKQQDFGVLVIDGQQKKTAQFTPAVPHAMLHAPQPLSPTPQRAANRIADSFGGTTSSAPKLLSIVDAGNEPQSSNEPPSYAFPQELIPPTANLVSQGRIAQTLPIEPWQSTNPGNASSPLTGELPSLSVGPLELPDQESEPQSAIGNTARFEDTLPGEPSALWRSAQVQQSNQPLQWHQPQQTVPPNSVPLEAAPLGTLEMLPPNANLPMVPDSFDASAIESPAILPTPAPLTVPPAGVAAGSELDQLLNETLAQQSQHLELSNLPNPDWIGQVRLPLLRFGSQSNLTLTEAIHTAIQFAPELNIMRADVDIQCAEITKRSAVFDWNQFVNLTWDELNVPFSSDLDGVTDRLENHTLASTAGLRKRNQLGGQLRLAQDMGFADSNSQFFNPIDQARARVSLEYHQPLLRGAGLLVNTSRLKIATANLAISQEELVAGIQQHISQVADTYWELVVLRGEYVVRRRAYDRAMQIAASLGNRVQLDGGPVQVARAEAALESRRNAMLQAEYAVVFAQEKLLRLVFGNQFQDSANREIIPTSNMLGPVRGIDLDAELQLGLRNRPEIRQAIQQIKKASIDQGVAKNQLLPLLGLSLSFSNTGLQGNRGLASALNDQWDLGDPTYGVGMSYAFPIRNRAAKANLRQAQLRSSQLQSDFDKVVADVALEIRNAVHAVGFSGEQRQTTANAMALAGRELEILEQRAELLLDSENTGPLYLDNLLQTQDRLVTAELNFLLAGGAYAQAHFNLQRANGVLLRCSDLPHGETGFPGSQYGSTAQAPASNGQPTAR